MATIKKATESDGPISEGIFNIFSQILGSFIGGIDETQKTGLRQSLEDPGVQSRALQLAFLGMDPFAAYTTAIQEAGAATPSSGFAPTNPDFSPEQASLLDKINTATPGGAEQIGRFKERSEASLAASSQAIEAADAASTRLDVATTRSKTSRSAGKRGGRKTLLTSSGGRAGLDDELTSLLS